MKLDTALISYLNINVLKVFTNICNLSTIKYDLLTFKITIHRES